MKHLAAYLFAACMIVVAAGGVRAQYVMDIGNLMYSIQFGDLAEEVEPVHDATTIYVTRITSLAGIRVNNDLISRKIVGRERDLRRFRRAIGSVRKARRILDIHGQTLDQVIWATHSGGSAMLYVDDR